MTDEERHDQGATATTTGGRGAASDGKQTWRDWLPEDEEEPADDELITRGELLEHLRAAHVDISERTLQLWEAAGVIPGPIRRWHNGATRALYAPWVVYLAILAELGRSGGHSTEAVATHTKSAVRAAIHRVDVWTWPAMREGIPAALEAFADRYEQAMGERPATAEIRTRRADGQTLAVYHVDIPPRGRPT